MIQLIAESGSTKTSWYLIQQSKVICTTQTLGMNPYFVQQSELISILQEVVIFLDGQAGGSTRGQIAAVLFYGSGYGNPETKKLLKEAFDKVFLDVPVQIETDLLAAARALFGHEPGIACIMGTGSNCGMYDGIDFTDNVPSLGFSLGDEGSAGFFGKWIVRDYYFKSLPPQIEDYLNQHFQMDINITLDRLYRQKHGNAYIASFAQIIATFREDDYILDLVERGIEEFMRFQLGYFSSSTRRKVGMVGSVAYYHKEQISRILARDGWDLVKVLQHPIQELVAYHTHMEE